MRAEVMEMPNNKSQKINNIQNDASMTEQAITLKPRKAAEYPPSINKIDKREG